MAKGNGIQAGISLSAAQAEAVGPVVAYYVEQAGLDLEEAQNRATLDAGFGETSRTALGYVAQSLRPKEQTTFGADGNLSYSDVYGGGLPTHKPHA
ncbi:MAG: hypothetical protein HRT94_02530 [Alphaproteobacteria bacterium]|nr:hypothetical protein [Alphaproteobacteria bacterium]